LIPVTLLRLSLRRCIRERLIPFFFLWFGFWFSDDSHNSIVAFICLRLFLFFSTSLVLCSVYIELGKRIFLCNFFFHACDWVFSGLVFARVIMKTTVNFHFTFYFHFCVKFFIYFL
jgi:hypothetical protein